MKKIGFLIVLTAALFSSSLYAPLRTQAQETADSEKILSFFSDVTVHPDASMTVTEKITVTALGPDVEDRIIKRGIYRDFPTKYRDRNGNRYTTDFEVLEVKRGGLPEPFFTEKKANGVRVYIGKEDVFLEKGVYEYELKYRTGWQLGFFKDHDELYWNATGNGWDFPIDRAACIVRLPAGVPPDKIKTTGYTGPQGSREQALKSEVRADGTVYFEAARPLGPQEGLTIVAEWPKGFVHEPTPAERRARLIHNNPSLIFGAAGLILLLGYYLIAWGAVGRDPRKGVIMPLYAPPDNLSPAAMRYIMDMSFDNECVAAALIDMAVKGSVKIEKKDGKYTLHAVGAAREKPAPEEALLYSKLFSKGKSIELEDENHAKISGAISAVKGSLSKSYMKKYFLANTAFFVPGIIISVITTLVIVAASGAPEALIQGFGLSVWTVGVFFLVKATLTSWYSFLFQKKASAFVPALLLSLISIPFLGGEAVGLYFFSKSTSFATGLFLICIIMLTFIFHHLLKAPTALGRKAMDKIEGFKLFLSMAEKERLNQGLTLDKTPETFEKFLPYALALGVDNLWAENFSGVLGAAAVDADGTTSAYHPLWYTGGALSMHDIGSSFGSSLSSAISSSSTAPGSSSGGGGGGSSGGGGGGGGGGGW